MTLKGARRAFRTVVFTDIVGSTEMAAELGDRRWRRTLGSHNALIRRELKRNHGAEIDTAGDGFFTLFENPTDALQFVAAAVAGVHGLNLRIRGAVHTGEVEPAGAKVGGIAVHIGARLLQMAGTEEVLVSGTVHDLVAGSGHEFEDRGTHELRGVPGEWRVYSLVLPRLDASLAASAADDEEARQAAGARRQRVVVGGLLAVIVLLAVGIGAILFALGRPSARPSGPDAVVAYGGGNQQPAGGWRVGRGPEQVALARGVLWVASSGSGTVTRIDLGAGAATSVGQGVSRPSSVLVAGNRVWVADRYSSQISVLGAEQGDLLDRLEDHAAAMVEAAGRIWLADDLHERLVALDPQTFVVATTVDLQGPQGAADIAVADGALWVTTPRSDRLLRVDPATGAIEPVATDIAGLRSLSALASDLWIASPAADTVARLDAASRRVLMRTTVCDVPVAIAALSDGAWVACAGDRQLWRLDAAGNAITKIALDGVPADVAADGDRVWVALRAD